MSIIHDKTAREVEYYAQGTWETVLSERTYITVSEIRGVVQDEPTYAWPRKEAVNLTLYLDPETGLVVFDVEAYERSRR